MDLFVTRSAQGDQVFFGIITEQATGLNVMNLEFAHASRNIGSAIRLALGSFDGVHCRVVHRVLTGGVCEVLCVTKFRSLC